MGRFNKKFRLIAMIWMVAGFIPVEMIVGYVTNSTALIADSFHMLSDVVSLIIALLSVQMSTKEWSKNTFGWARAEILGALVNSVFLVALCFSISVEACKRFIEVEDIHDPQLLVVTGSLGLLVNVIGLFLFHEHGHSHGVPSHKHEEKDCERDHTNEKTVIVNKNHGHSHSHGHSHNHGSHMNIRGVFLHVLSDALGSIVVIISALIVWLTEWEYRLYVDPILSLIMAVLITSTAWPLLKQSALILLQSVPTHIQVEAVKEGLLKTVDGVLEVNNFHVWQLDGDRIIASAQIKYESFSDYLKVSEKVKQYFHNEGIHTVTLEPVFISHNLPGEE